MLNDKEFRIMSYESKKIHSLQEYLGWVKEVQTSDCFTEKPHNDLFFRGHANKWDIKPSLYRKHFDEYELLNTAKMRGWSYLKDCQSELEMLIMLQHYGLPTRLLDVTTNPLVALYFACQKGTNEENGYVLWGHHCNEDGRFFAEMVAHILFMPSTDFVTEKQCDYLKTSFSNCNLNNSYKEIFSKSLFFFPAQNNPRIIAQSGAFLMTRLIDSDNSASNSIVRAQNDDGSNSIAKRFSEWTAIIPIDIKEDLLQELDLCGINQASLFPDLANLTEYIKNRCEMYKGMKFDDIM